MAVPPTSFLRSLQYGTNRFGIVVGDREVASCAVPTDQRKDVPHIGCELARQHAASGPEVRETHTKRGRHQASFPLGGAGRLSASAARPQTPVGSPIDGVDLLRDEIPAHQAQNADYVRSSRGLRQALSPPGVLFGAIGNEFCLQ
jgi:hypothetical protein